jgi:hypothetical protein
MKTSSSPKHAALGAYIIFMGLNIVGVQIAATFELVVTVLASAIAGGANTNSIRVAKPAMAPPVSPKARSAYAKGAFGETGGAIAGFATLIEFVFAPPAIALAIGAYLNVQYRPPAGSRSSVR